MRLWISVLTLALAAACKTGGAAGGSDAPPPILSGAGLAAPGDETTPVSSAGAPPIFAAAPAPVPRPAEAPRPAISLLPPPPLPMLDESLKPVRGGERVLPRYRGPAPCRMALTGDSPVARACSEGGEQRALDLMSLFVKRARAEGFNFKCGDCHLDEDDRTRLSPTADADFRKLLFLARPAD